MSRASYQVRLQRNLDQMARRTQERREDRNLHADAVCRRYVEAYKANYGQDRHCVASYDPRTGYYQVSNTPTKLREKQVTDAIDYYYACVHERELTANLPSEDI